MPTKWEYTQHTTDTALEARDLTDNFGDNGWQLVAVLNLSNGRARYYFKREKT